MPLQAQPHTRPTATRRARRRARHADHDPSTRTTGPTRHSCVTGTLDREENLALQEKARHGHHHLLVWLDWHLHRRGWSGIEEIPAAIDLRGTGPQGGRVIFEAETMTAANETDQCRSAVAQLLEYRLEYGRSEGDLCLAVDDVISLRRLEILQRLGIAVVQASDAELRPLNEIGQEILETPPFDYDSPETA